MKQRLKGLAAGILFIFLAAGCGGTKAEKAISDGTVTEKAALAEETRLVYGSNDYTRINPAIDEHGEINILIFNGLTAHDAQNEVVPSLAKSWDLDEDTNTYTFHLEENVKWHDGEKFTAEDVKFTIEAIKDPANESEIASNYEDVEEITVTDDYTISFRLKEKNVAFKEYMTIGILPKHLLEGEDMQTSSYFKFPIGTGPYKMEAWEEGQSIALAKNEDYFKGAPKIDKIYFKIVVDDNAKALQLKSGELDLAKITPKDAKTLQGDPSYQIYEMKTADYRGILYNFNHEFFKKNRGIIPALNYAIDREAMVDSVLLGEGVPAYGPLQRNKFNNEQVEKYEYDPELAKKLIEAEGFEKGADGIYEKDREKLSFTIHVMEGDQVRADLAAIAAQQLKEIGVDVKAEVKAEIDWENQEAFLIGWGSPFDADDHTYKVFGTGKGSNFSSYSNENVDKYLTQARMTDDDSQRMDFYGKFQEELVNDPPYTFLCYCDVNYVANKKLSGITKDTVLSHHGVGIFWNVKDWTIQ